MIVFVGVLGWNFVFVLGYFLLSGEFGSLKGVLIVGYNDIYFVFLKYVVVGE